MSRAHSEGLGEGNPSRVEQTAARIVRRRRQKPLDLRLAVEALKQGQSLCSAAAAQGTTCTTLRRRLIQAGLWPVPPLSGTLIVVP